MIGFPVTASELREATRQAKEDYKERSDEKKVKDWLRWFCVAGPEIVQEAVRKGLSQISVDLPWQPVLVGGKNVRPYLYKEKLLSAYVKEMMEGCKMDYAQIETENENGVYYILDISWA